jgi:hypothetical protein
MNNEEVNVMHHDFMSQLRSHVVQYPEQFSGETLEEKVADCLFAVSCGTPKAPKHLLVMNKKVEHACRVCIREKDGFVENPAEGQ